MTRIADWNTLSSAAKWLSLETGKEWHVADLLTECKDGKLRIMFVPTSWKRVGIGELKWTWFDKEGMAHPGKLVSDGWIALNQVMCNELMRRGMAHLSLATMEQRDITSGAVRTLTACGDNLPFVTLDQLCIGREELENYYSRIDRIQGVRDSEGGDKRVVADVETDPPWISKHALIAAFALAYKHEEYWVNATSRRWPQRFANARRGGKVGGAGAQYNPVELALVLRDKGVKDAALTKVFDLLERTGCVGWKEKWMQARRDLGD